MKLFSSVQLLARVSYSIKTTRLYYQTNPTLNLIYLDSMLNIWLLILTPIVFQTFRFDRLVF